MTRNFLLKSIGLTVLSSSVLFASGWRIPEQSSKSVALSGAYIANSNGADATYYNPANMVFNPNKHQLEISLMNIHLTSIDYKDNRNSRDNSDSLNEDFLIPTMFLSSKAYGNLRYGLSFTAPGGLGKRWDEPYGKIFAEEFTLKILELNPTIAYKVSENFSVAAGVRLIYSEGVVKSDGTGTSKPAKRDMEGEATALGYNLALAYKPTSKSNLSLTYRSNVEIKEDGNAKLYANGIKLYDDGADVTIPLPAVLTLAYSHKIQNATFEFVYDKTYWSKYKNLDFEYDGTVHPALSGEFDDPKPRNWKDTDAFRIGMTLEIDKDNKFMMGYAIDKNPAPEAHIGFELPDSDARLYSLGFDHKLDANSSIGFGYLYDEKKKRTVKTDDGNIDGTFSNAKAHLISVAYRHDF